MKCAEILERLETRVSGMPSREEVTGKICGQRFHCCDKTNKKDRQPGRASLEQKDEGEPEADRCSSLRN